MRIFCLTTYVLLWSISAPDVHADFQMMMLKALQQVKSVPIILSVSRRDPKRLRASTTDIVDIKTSLGGQEIISGLSTNPHESANYAKRKSTKKSKVHTKVKYVYLKGGIPKKYLKRPSPSYTEYFDGPVKKEVLYEDEDHKFIRVSASRPQPRYTHLKVIHVNNADTKDCPYLASQGYRAPHSTEGTSVGKHEAAAHENSEATQQQHQHVTHVIHHLNYLGHPQDHEPRDHKSKPEVPVEGSHDRRHHPLVRTPEPTVTVPKIPHRYHLNPRGPTSSAIAYHTDTGPSAGRHYIKPPIELHLVNDEINRHRQQGGEKHDAFPQYLASSSQRHGPNSGAKNHGTVTQDFYQPRFPEEQERSKTVEPRLKLGTKLYASPDHDDRNPIFAETTAYADVMNRWSDKDALVISDLRGNPVVFASAKSPPFKFRNGIRRRSVQNFIDVVFH